MCCVVMANAQLGTPPNNEIWYTTTDGKVCEPHKEDVFGTSISFNKYENGHGTIKFEGDVTAIGEQAFYKCSCLVSISMPNSVTAIGEKAFFECSCLVSISMPNSATSIGNWAFAYCSSLISISIPNSVTAIGESAFGDCPSLKSITIPYGVKRIEGYTFNGCTNLMSVTIPNSVTSIGNDAFHGCKGLTTIEIPNSVTNIGEYAFSGCKGLTTIEIPNSVTNIGMYAFNQCSNLSDMFFWGDHNITIGERCFFGTQATIYVADKTNFPDTWDGKQIKSWRSGRGNGSAASPLEIESYQQLYGFSLEVRQGNTGICGKLTADIKANNSVLNEDGTVKAGLFKIWLPIGDWGNGNGYNGYSGEFDGGGHTISGLYFNDESRSAVGLFGMTNNSGSVTARIHNVGIKDSYFRGKSHAGGICGDLANGKIENCWNAATVQSKEGTTGGIVGSCWKYSTISGCYNIGKVAEGTACGGICGSVAKNVNESIYSVSYSISLEGTCDVAYNLYKDDTHKEDAEIGYVYIKNAEAFASGEVCWILNGNKTDTKWRQLLGKDAYPVWTGNYLVNHSAEKGYYNETMCDEKGVHKFNKITREKCDGSTLVFWQCEECAKYFTDADRTKEETNANTSKHFPEYVMGIVPTETSAGRYGYYYCTNADCEGHDRKFMDEILITYWDEDEINVPIAKNNEIWYTSTDDQHITHGVKYKESEYRVGMGYIVLEDGVTEIADNAFNRKSTLSSVFIPSSVKKIGNSSFWGCSALESVIFSSLPDVDIYAFGNCGKLSTIALDLTDSDKPYVCTSLANYPAGGFTKARYRRTLEKDKLETIVLPFVPTAESIAGLEFYTLTSISDAKTIFTKVKDIHAGEPYLIKNTLDTKEFTIIAADPKSITIKSSDQCADNFIKSSDQCADNFTMKATFQKATLTNDTDRKFYYLSGDKFLSITKSQEIDPFRAYIETPNTSAPESLEIITQGGSADITGDGTKANPYKIKNKADLDWFVDEVNTKTPNACAVLMADIKYNGEAKLLDADGNINSGSFDSWRPIGNSTNSYSGEFNGNGHTISGLYINDENKEKIGLFGKVVSGAHIHNLGVNDSYFKGKDHVGGICGDFANGMIENCWSEASIYVTKGDGGGLTGSVFTNAVLKDCYTISSVDGAGSRGLVCGALTGTIENCYARRMNAAGAEKVIGWTSSEGSPTAVNVEMKDEDAFKSGEVCWLLNGGSSENVKWHQMLGESGNKYPALTGEKIVYLTAKKCDGSAKAFSNTKPESVTQDEHNLISHDASVSTCTTQGCIKHRSCTNCGHLFKYDSDDELTKEQVFLAIDPDNHNLSLNDGKAHCEWCKQDWEHYLAQDDKPVLLNAGNDSYSLDKVELKYGYSYLCTDDVDVNNFSYTFPYYPNVWNSLFVPFEISTDELGVNGLGFTAAYIAGVRQYEKDASGNIITQVDVVKIKNGKLRAGTPYLIKKESTATEPSTITFNKTGAKLKESSKVNNIHTETATAKYDFIGTYNEIAKEDVKSNYYIIGNKGAFAHPSSPIYAMNWYMEITDKGAVYDEAVSLVKTIIINVIGEEDETTGIRTLYPVEKQVKEVYDLSGRRLDAPKRGQVNIINGKKILVK